MRLLLLFVLLAIVLPPRVALSEPTAPHADHDHAAMLANEALPAASATPDPHAGHDHAAINAAPELPAKLAELSTAERAPQPGQLYPRIEAAASADQLGAFRPCLRA